MNKLVPWIVCWLLVTLAGCKVGPDYKRPDPNLPEHYRQSQDLTQEKLKVEASLALRDWNDLYQDAQLQKLITAGLAHNLDLALARSRVREARYYMAVNRSTLLPQLDLGLELERERESALTNTDPGPESISALYGLLSWEIDLWGQNRRALEASEALWLATEADRQAARVSLIGEIAAVYFELLDIDNQIAISQRTITSREEGVRFGGLRKGRGIVSELEVQQARVELATAKTTLPVLRRSRLIKENQLSILLGRAPSDIQRELDINAQPLPEAVPVGLPSALLQRRPDIRQAEQELIAANAAIGIAEGEFFPKLSLTGSYGRESHALGNILKTGGEAWILGLDAFMPIFNAGRNRVQLAIAREKYEQALLRYRKVVLSALQEVSDALESYARSREEFQAYQELVKAAQEYDRLARLQYYNGIRSYLDLLDAQRQLFNAELSLSESKRDRLLALVQLYKALGGGWQKQNLTFTEP